MHTDGKKGTKRIVKYINIYKKNPIYIYIENPFQNGKKMTSFRGATAARPSWELA